MTSYYPLHPHLLAQRARVAFFALTLGFSFLAAAFFRVQILQHRRLRLLSESNRLRPVPLAAPRGRILDRHGAIIAENVPGYAVSLLAGSEDSLRRFLDRMARVVPLTPERVASVIARYQRAPHYPVVIMDDASFVTVSALEEHRPVLRGLVISAQPRRGYPDSTAVAHLVGYIGEASSRDLASPLFAGRRPGALVGQEGLERQYERDLAGADGMKFVEVDAGGRVVREEDAAEALAPVPGRDLATTIDLGLQRFVAEIFPKGARGALVAMEPTTGEILALYSQPAYDPNAFVGGVSPALWKALNDDPARPLLNRAISARYPPASTWKLAVALVALRRGLVRFDSRMRIPCQGGMQFGNRYFRCWRQEGHGSLTLMQAIAQSCDVYFYQLGLRLGVRAQVEDGVALGFASRTMVDLPGELRPAYPTSVAYYDRLYGPRRWTEAVGMNLAIGQGENAQTLINMVQFYAALAADGEMPVPHLFRRPVRAQRNIDLADSAFALLRQSLLAVVESGTARGARLARIRLAGKTGTAQNPHGPDHGWFIGFAPAEQPSIVVGGVVEFAQHGSLVAPLVARVIERYLLGPEAVRPGAEPLRFLVPADSAPRSVPLDSVRRGLQAGTP